MQLEISAVNLERKIICRMSVKTFFRPIATAMTNKNATVGCDRKIRRQLTHLFPDDKFLKTECEHRTAARRALTKMSLDERATAVHCGRSIRDAFMDNDSSI